MMKYLYLILIIGFVSCSSNSTSNEGGIEDTRTEDSKTTEKSINDDAKSNGITDGATTQESESACNINSLFEEELSLPLKINYDFFTKYDNIGDKIFIPYDCVNDGKEEEVEGLPLNIFYAYGKVSIGSDKEYCLVIETGNPDNPLDLMYTSAILFSNNDGVLDNGIEIGKYHAYSGVREYYDAQLNWDGTINQKITKIGNDGISERVFEERDTSFNIIK